MFSIAAILIKKLESDSNNFIPYVLAGYAFEPRKCKNKNKMERRSSELKQNVIFLEGKEQRGPKNLLYHFAMPKVHILNTSPNAINYVLF